MHESSLPCCCCCLQCSVRLNANQTQIGKTALIGAAEEGHTNCVRLLLEAGASKEARDAVC